MTIQKSIMATLVCVPYMQFLNRVKLAYTKLLIFGDCNTILLALLIKRAHEINIIFI